MTDRLFILLAVVALLAGSVAACGDGENAALAQATSAKDIEQLDPALLPGEILGLKVAREDMTDALKQARRSYVDAVGLWSLRREELVTATLQVSRFNENADYKNSEFRQQVVQQLGGTAPQEVVIGDERVNLSRSTKQTLAIWFRDDHFVVLAVRDDFEHSRALIREALELEV